MIGFFTSSWVRFMVQMTMMRKMTNRTPISAISAIHHGSKTIWAVEALLPVFSAAKVKTNSFAK